ncbi:hypothetical protein DFQ27_005974 [Actinomortierella ambigua]|uniref:Uncharacterized protein n=1 Tax=Actinomortierella ambigua TaxID=1343610 RepID=A0A9P6Q0H3_9FUNG|nr:hypothetical protein DFQ27_005974 [Actinomortierella ambigua]
MVHKQLRAVIAIASLYLLSLVTLSVRDLQGVDVQNIWYVTDWLEFLGLCGLYVVTGMLGLMTAQTVSLRVTRWFGTAWWCCTALSAASTLGFVALLFRPNQEAAAKELYEAIHQYDLKFSGIGGGGGAASRAVVAAAATTAGSSGSTSSSSSTLSPSLPVGSGGYRSRGYSACHDGILYGDRSLSAGLNSGSTPPEGWFVAFVSNAILDSVVQVVFMTLVCLATARLQAYLEESLESTHSQGSELSAVEAGDQTVGKDDTTIVDDEKTRLALVAAGYLEVAEKK